MIDINLIRKNKTLVENNLKKKFQENKLPILEEIIEIDQKVRELKINGDSLRQERNKISDEIEGKLIQTAGIFLGKQMEG